MYNGKNQLASEQLHQAVSLNPTGLQAWESLAALQLNCGEVVEAAETYEKLVSPLYANPGVPSRLSCTSNMHTCAQQTSPSSA